MTDISTAFTASGADRRAFLTSGAATVVAVSAFAPAGVADAATTNAAKFKAADQAFIAAENAKLAYVRDVLDPADERLLANIANIPGHGEAVKSPAYKAAAAKERARYDVIEARYNDLYDHRYEALDALIATHAPDTNAVARKLQLLIADEAWDSKGWEESVGHVLADLRRLGRAA